MFGLNAHVLEQTGAFNVYICNFVPINFKNEKF